MTFVSNMANGMQACPRHLPRNGYRPWSNLKACVTAILLYVFLPLLACPPLFAQHYYVDLTDALDFDGFEGRLIFATYGSDATAGSPGHAFVIWSHETPQGTTIQTAFGFYGKNPEGLTDDLRATFGFIPGHLEEESKLTQESATKTLELRVNERMYRNSMMVKDKWNTAHPGYGLLTNNCIDFMIEVGQSLGLEMPSRGPLNLTPNSYLQSLINDMENRRITTTNHEFIAIRPNGDYRIGNVQNLTGETFDNPNFSGKVRESFADGYSTTAYLRNGKVFGILVRTIPNAGLWYFNNLGKTSPISRFYYPNGSVLDPYMDQAPFQNGTLTMPDGTVFIGPSRGGTPDGDVLVIDRSGLRHRAQYSLGKFIKVVPVQLADGYYIGNFDASGNATGNATRVWSSGVTYNGAFVNGMPSGHAQMTSGNGSRFSGDFVDGKAVNGTFTTADGTYYSGPFINGTIPDGAVWRLSEGSPLPNYPSGTPERPSGPDEMVLSHAFIRDMKEMKETHAGDVDHTPLVRQGVDFSEGRETKTFRDKDGKEHTVIERFEPHGLDIQSHTPSHDPN